MLNFLKNLSPIELAVIGIIIVALFGAKFAIGLGKTSGESFKEIKKIKKNFSDAIEDESSDNKESSK